MYHLGLLLVLGLSGQSIARSVCKSISDGEIVDGVSEQAINDCYACKGWHKVEEGTAYSVLQWLPDKEVVYQQDYQWCGETADDKFEVFFRRPIKFAGFAIRASEPDAWVKELEVWYGDDSNELWRARNAAGGEVFHGNVNERITKENKFAPPITATFIRFVPKSFESRPCFRINFYSCKKQGYVVPEPPMSTDSDLSKEESDEMSEEDDCPPFQCNITCLVFLEDEYGCKRCGCDRTNPGLFEGDIRFDPSTIEYVEIAYGIREDTHGIMRGGMGDNNKRWVNYPSGDNYIIPYELDRGLTSAARQAIPPALQEIEDASCLQFRVRTDQTYYIKFIRDSGCYSYLGNINRASGGQEISIGDGCHIRGIIQHEAPHALGFWHEQSRKDRDEYVNIIMQNIIPGIENNFMKRDDTRDFDSAYDFGSVMHYGNKHFSRNGQDTLQAISDPSMEFGQRVRFSTEDITQLQRMYQCDVTVTTTTTSTTTPTTTPSTTTTPTTTTTTTTTPTTTTTTTTTTPTTTTPTTTTPTTTTPTTTTAKPCFNRRRRRRCRRWRRRGYCRHTYVRFMRRNCAKACRMCR